jgi:putative transposase
VGEFIEHYHHERNYQALGNQLILPVVNPTQGLGRIVTRGRLGGLLKYYHRAAA